MSALAWLNARLRGGTTSHLPLERAILRRIVDQLDPAAATKLRRQLELITLVQRLDGGREVNCYPFQGWKRRQRDDSLALSSGAEEEVLATFAFTSPEGHGFKGNVWLVNGFLFSIEFNLPTEHVLETEPTDLKVKVVWPKFADPVAAGD